MTFSCVTPEEVRRKYRSAENKEYILGVLADLTAASKTEVKDFLGVGSDYPRLRKQNVKVDEVKAQELYGQGLCDAAIADKIGTSRTSVSGWRRKKGLPRNVPPKRPDNRMELYLQGLGDDDIAKLSGFSKKQVFDWRHNNRLPSNIKQGGDRRSKAFREKRKPDEVNVCGRE